MFRMLILSAAAVSLGLMTTNRAVAYHKHLHHSIYELRLAHEELRKAGYDFGGNREKGLIAIDLAYHQMEKCLEAVGEPYDLGFIPPAGIYTGYRDHQHLRHSLVELRAAHAYLKASSSNFGGHKTRALLDIDAAIYHVERCIAHIR